ncbi:SDR family oxidoreductase [Candidatus Binatia bacterium]|nr:SDR family oxidoreductase [Candidatus Binatia bacterium]
MELAGRAALITGGGTGTGRAVALELARRGCHVAVNYSKSRREAEDTAAEIDALGVKGLAVQADVGDDTAVRRMVDEVSKKFGRLDVLVNSAGATAFVPHADLEALSDADWDRILNTNLKGAFYAIRAALPWLRQDNGVVVNVSSIAGVYAIGSSVAYCASKAALNNMTVALARALAPGVRINAVAPGFIDTRWWKEFPAYELMKNIAVGQTLVGKACQPEDIAATVVHLVTADFVTGQVWVIDGGHGIAGGMPRV